MANVKDAQVLVAGSIVSLDFLRDRDTKAQTGAKVLIIAGDGVAVVKLDNEQLASVQPVAGTRVAWYVRNAAYAVDNNSGMSTKFVRVADLGDLDLVNAIILDSAGSKAPAKV